MSDVVSGAASVELPGARFVSEQRRFYEDRSTRCRRLYLASEVVILGLSVLVTVVGVVEGVPRVVVSLLSASLTVAVGLGRVFRWQERWTSYRYTAETLRGESLLCEIARGPYAPVDPRDRDAELAERSLSLTTRELRGWQAAQMAQGGPARRAEGDVPR